MEERWGEIARYPDLIHAYADRLLPMLRRAWADQVAVFPCHGTAIGLSCLLQAGRYTELQDLLAMQRMRFWSWHRFGAEVLLRQGLWEAAIAHAEGTRDDRSGRYDHRSIDKFCEGVLLRQGRGEEAYRHYGLRASAGATNLAVYRALVRAYPDRDQRGILLDLIESRGERGKRSRQRRMPGSST